MVDRGALNRVLVGALRILVLAGVGYFTIVFFAQRMLAFPGTFRDSPRSTSDAPQGVIQTWLSTSFGRVEAWHFPPSSGDGGPLVIFAHGNGELIEDWRAEMEGLSAQGVGALLVEFPGYGHSDGSPTRATLRETYSAAFDWLVEEEGLDPGRVVSWGRSMGGAVAADLALDRPVAALVLQSTFSSAAAMAREALAPGFLVRDRFDTRRVVSEFPEPILLMHGRADDVISYRHSEVIADAREGLTVTDIDCAHNDCARAWPEIVGHVTDFLRGTGLLDD